MQDLAGRTAIVTGAASGIGLGMARAFAQVGMNVALCDIRQAPLDRALAEVRGLGARAIAIVTDVSERASVERAAVEAERELGRIHVACNNAGVAMHGVPIETLPAADWDWVIGVNLYGTLHGVRTFVPHMKAHGEPSHIVSTSSMSGLTPKALAGPYGATKFAIVGLSHVLRDELKETNIGVSVLCPGWTKTNMPDNGRNRPERFGGPYDFRKDPLLAARNKEYVENSAKGLDPLDLAALVVRAIEENEFYIMTEPGRRGSVAARYDELMAAFDAVADRLPRILKAS